MLERAWGKPIVICPAYKIEEQPPAATVHTKTSSLEIFVYHRPSG